MSQIVHIAGAALLSLSTNCYCAGDLFACHIEMTYTLTPQGTLNSEDEWARNNRAIYRSFRVNRKTGEISGNPRLDNTSIDNTRYVIDDEPRMQNYKVLTRLPPFTVTEYLEIRQADDAIQKPFVFKDAWGHITTGLCTIQ